MNTPRRISLLILALPAFLGLVASGCQQLSPPPPEEFGLWADVSAGVDDRNLSRICEEVWEDDLANDPFMATRLGDPRFNGQVPSIGVHRRRMRTQTWSELLLACKGINRELLSERDQLTLDMLKQKLEGDIAVAKLDLDDWNVDPLAGPHITLLNMAQIQPHSSFRERVALVKRWNEMGRYMQQAGANLKRGAQKGLYAPRHAVRTSIQQLDEIIETSVFDSPLMTPATGGGRWITLAPYQSISELAHRELGDARQQKLLHTINLHLADERRLAAGTQILIPSPYDPLDATTRGKLVAQVLEAIEKVIYPAMEEYREVLRDDILFYAREEERAGLVDIEGGLTAYRTLMRQHTSLPLEECNAQEIHDFGLAEVARIRSEISSLGQALLGTSEVPRIQERLRSSPELHFKTRDEVEAKALSALARARKAMPAYFNLLPQAACEVVRIPAYEEKNTTIAYYNAPAADGSRPGIYYINTYAPETRPRYEAEVLAYHEAIPGHHLQLAIAQELTEIPLFRRHSGPTAFVEGWALYTERLSDEMGLYSGDMDRMGMLSYDAWRASRLVVDTGIHAFGWSRQQAIDYMHANTLLALNNVENEVDRYIAWPGQALAYKIGQREMIALRDQARAVQGAAFSYPAFHDAILQNGALTLESLRTVVAKWLGE